MVMITGVADQVSKMVPILIEPERHISLLYQTALNAAATPADGARYFREQK